MHNIEYHRATESDIQILVDFRISFLIEFLGPQTNEKMGALRSHLEEFFIRTITNKTYICWYAKAGDELAGVGGLSVRQHPGNFLNLSGRMGYIMNMYTLPEHRRKGVCSNILVKLQESANEIGIYSFELHATKEGEMVYAQHDFKLHDEPTYRKYQPDKF